MSFRFVVILHCIFLITFTHIKAPSPLVGFLLLRSVALNELV